ncbi:hypothetical protein KEJ28_04605 [Candidatus Bathyarchaeota archaeon]|nr:hypothetical protein [Candidatus Bathyarchaeota archaeon]
MKRLIASVLILLLAIAVRLYPTLETGMPFSTDGWGPIRNAEGIIAHSPIPLTNETVFDGYHSYWPAVSIFGAVLSITTGLKAINAMSMGIPLVAALSTLILYALMKKVCGEARLALLSALLLAIIYPHALFTAGVTKEAYATPLYLTAMLLFLGYGKMRETLLFMIVSIALVTAHHLAALATVAILFSIAAGWAIINFKMGWRIEKSAFTPSIALAAAAGIYLELYAYNGLIAKTTIALSDIISAFSYQATAFAITLYLVAKKPKPKPSTLKSIIKCVAPPLLILALIVICIRRPIIPSAPILPARYLAYATPFLIAAPLSALGAGGAIGGKSPTRLVLAFWLSALLGLEGYALFGSSPIGLTLIYRVINMISIPLAALCAIGFYKLALTPKDSGRRLTWIASATLLAIVASNIYNVYASVSLRERYMGYFWAYTPSEFTAGRWLLENANNTIAGDVKASYLLKEYFKLNVDATYALRYFSGEASKPPKLLILYDLMNENGYVLYGGYSVNLPQGWINKTLNLSQIYSNNYVKAYIS